MKMYLDMVARPSINVILDGKNFAIPASQITKGCIGVVLIFENELDAKKSRTKFGGSEIAEVEVDLK